MFRKYLLIAFSIVHILAGKEALSNTKAIVLSCAAEVLESSFGGGLPFKSGGERSTIINERRQT